MLRVGGLKPSITELLNLLDVLKHGITEFSVENFYYLARATMIKDESLYDRFDQVFAAHFSGIEKMIDDLFSEVPEEWLKKQSELMLTEAERAEIEAMGGFEKLIETLKKRFTAISNALIDNEETIVNELNSAQGQTLNIGGYYKPNEETTSKEMKPSSTLNNTLNLL